MATSSYYRDQARQYREEAKKYRRQKEKLQSILDAVTGKFDDNVSDVNKALNECRSDLIGDGVRKLATFDSTQGNILESVKEKYDGQDPDLKGLRDALESEMTQLERKAAEADEQADYYDRQADRAAERERAERAERLKAAAAKLLGK